MVFLPLKSLLGHIQKMERESLKCHHPLQFLVVFCLHPFPAPTPSLGATEWQEAFVQHIVSREKMPHSVQIHLALARCCSVQQGTGNSENISTSAATCLPSACTAAVGVLRLDHHLSSSIASVEGLRLDHHPPACTAAKGVLRLGHSASSAQWGFWG